MLTFLSIQKYQRQILVLFIPYVICLSHAKKILIKAIHANLSFVGNTIIGRNKMHSQIKRIAIQILAHVYR